MEKDPKVPPTSKESSIKNTGTRKVSSKKTTKPSPPTGLGSSRASPAASPHVTSQSVHKALEGVEEENEDDDDDNSFDHNDDLSVSLPASDGDDVVEVSADAVSMSQRAKRGRKRMKAGAGVPLSPAKCKVTRRKRAGCWKYFKVINVPSGKESGAMETKAKCRFCIISYAYHPGGSTTQMNRHLKKCTQYLNKLEKAKKQGKLNFDPDDGCPLVVNPTEYDHDHTRLLIAKMIIVHEYSFRMVEHKWFNVLMRWMNSNYEWIGRKTIKNECMKVFELEEDLLKKSLREAESISLTTDLWTSNQNIQYMCLVAHFVDANWVLQCRVLSFVELDPPHTGIVISNAVFDCLVEWKIEDKIMSIRLDNASNNDGAITNLKSKLAARKNTKFDPSYFHVRCAAHIVNLVVNDGLHPINTLIDNLRNAVKYFKKSPSRMYKFIEVCNNYSIRVGKGLALDVKTRWSSTFRMLESCIEYREAFGYYAETDHKYLWKPIPAEWELFEKLRPILGKMAGATTAFSGSAYPTANVFYPYIVNVKIVLREAQNSEDSYLKGMTDAMLDKFDKYWEVKNNLMVIATILETRFKMRYITWCFGEIYAPYRCIEEVDEITNELEELYNKYSRLLDTGKGNAQSISCSKDTTSSLASVVPAGFQNFLQSNTEVSKSELLVYLEEGNVSIDDKIFDLLNYWKVNDHRFPVLAAMAKCFLAVPASSVSSESTFSTGGRILDDYRSSLKPSTVQALVCASSWIRASQNDNSTPMLQEQDEDDDVENVEFPICVAGSN